MSKKKYSKSSSKKIKKEKATKKIVSAKTKSSKKTIKIPNNVKCEVINCSETPEKIIKIMGEKRYYCKKHFTELFKEFNSISDKEEKE